MLFLLTVFLEKFKQGERPLVFGDGEQTRDFIYVEDLVEFMMRSISQFGKTKHQLFHLANGKQVSVNEMIRLMKKISGSTIDPAYVEGIKGEVRDIVLDTTLAQKELGWNPHTDLEAGIKKTWESLH